MKFNSIDHGFCESVGHTLPYPEIYNSYSSIFISLMGIIGLLRTVYYERVYNISTIFGCLIINGLGSFMYHYTQQMGWAVIDELSMMIAVIMGVISLYSIILNTKFEPLLPFMNDVRFVMYTQRKYILYKSLLIIGCITYFVLSYSLSLFEETREIFPFLFAIPTLALIPGLTYVFNKYYICRKWYYGKVLYINGMVWSLLSALIWTISEPLCKQYHWIKYLHTHVIWHIGISYGMYNLLQFMLHYHLYHKAKTYYVVKFSKLGIPYIDVNVNKHHMQ